MSEERARPSGSWLRRLLESLSGEPQDLDELSEVLTDARERGLIDTDVFAMLEGVLQVSEIQVRDVMVPRSQMVVIQRDEPPERILPVVVESGHSRFPVVGEDRDEVVGILLAKDLLRYFADGGEGQFDIRECVRPAIFIPESKRLNVLLKEFRVSHNHMAIVVDEYGGVSGLLTIEDVLEQIVGDIGDEYDVDEGEGIRKEADGSTNSTALSAHDSPTRSSTRSAGWCCTNSAACHGVARPSRSAAWSSRLCAPTAAASRRCA